MIVLDENILESQRRLLRDRRIPARQIGYDIGRKGLKDKEIITFLLGLQRITFFTLDTDFYQRLLCHPRYCLVCLDVRKHEAAVFTRRFLRHPEFNSTARRLSKVVRASSVGISVWSLHAEREEDFNWAD